ncbi:hypothetical protein M9Y10_035121 [Tritrichomonas musculus]|uniref:Uncharacterized protein n=1 Tax=Tritrichomonas musculus TaxID=1915356 RepID=A0ABR2KHV4_9EUKA
MLIYAHIIPIVLQNVISVDCDNNKFYKKIIDLVEYMIDEDLISENALIEAVEIINHELFVKILENRKDSSSVNEIADRGNALYSAVSKTDFFSDKKLLSKRELIQVSLSMWIHVEHI